MILQSAYRKQQEANPKQSVDEIKSVSTHLVIIHLASQIGAASISSGTSPIATAVQPAQPF